MIFRMIYFSEKEDLSLFKISKLLILLRERESLKDST